MVYTRKDYMSSKCTHREYYGQLVTQSIKDHLNCAIPDSIAQSTHEVFSDISLDTWDRIGATYDLRNEFESLGDFRTQAGIICVLKEAAQQIREESRNNV